MADQPVIDPGSQLKPAATLGAAILFAVVVVALGQRLFAAALLSPAVAGLGAALQEGSFTFLLFGVLLAGAAIGLRIDGRRGGLFGIAPAATAGGGLAIGLFGLFASAGYAAIAGGIGGGSGEGQGGAALVLGSAAILFQAIVEEIYFRGWLQPVLVRRWGAAAGLLVAAAAFAMLHVAGGARTPLTLVNLFLGGVLFGLLALRSGGLAAPAAAHAAWNWAEQILLGLDPNPGSGSYGAIFDLDLVGAPLWGGSNEGLNASLAIGFVLIALILPVAAWPGRGGPASAPGSRG